MIVKVMALVCLALLVSGCAAEHKFVALHLTDGHPHNESLDADFGDLASFLEHYREKLWDEGKELLLFDSGDIIEGTGLSDATEIHGEFIFPIIELIQNYTALTMGNHDIGHSSTVALMRRTVIPHFNDGTSGAHYLTSNSYGKFTIVENGNTTQEEQRRDIKVGTSPLGQQYVLRSSRNGLNMLVLGFLYNFTLSASITSVETVSETLEEQWFSDAMAAAAQADVIFIPMHIDPQSTPEMQQIYSAVREANPETPIGIFAGHRHRKYWEMLDDNAFVIESGKYFEEFGLVQFTVDNDGHLDGVHHEWIPTSRALLVEMSGVNKDDFDTERGLQIKMLIQKFTDILHLDDVLGCSPIFYDPDAHFWEHDSLYRLFIDQLIPTTVYNTTLVNQQFFVTNTQTLRYYLYQGSVTLNDVWTISPFKDKYFYFPSIPGEMLREFVLILNDLPVAKHGRAPFVPLTNKVYGPRSGQDNEDDDGDELPPFYWSSTHISPSMTYDMVVAQYDAEQLEPVWQKFFPEYPGKYYTYPTSLDSTSAFAEFVVEQLPCSADCPC